MPEPFDLDNAWRLDAAVALRPEPFGALAYHYGTRQLSFLKDPVLVAVVRGLGSAASARAAIEAAVEPGAQPAFEAALARLAGSGMIVPAEAA